MSGRRAGGRGLQPVGAQGRSGDHGGDGDLHRHELGRSDLRHPRGLADHLWHGATDPSPWFALSLLRLVQRLEDPRRTGGLRDCELAQHGAFVGGELHAALLRMARGWTVGQPRKIRSGRRPVGHSAQAGRRRFGRRECASHGRPARSRPGRPLPRLRPYAGELPDSLLAHQRTRLQTLRDLVGGGQPQLLRAGCRQGHADAGGLPAAPSGPGHRRGAARLCGREEGLDARRLYLTRIS
mmetsp:Transcript_5253/g.9276  ORF Transcript_5253/g.9276 Transcript_5253/m.9276 type:complete len:239 (+) Transcript_5253:869-1585(+)